MLSTDQVQSIGPRCLLGEQRQLRQAHGPGFNHCLAAVCKSIHWDDGSFCQRKSLNFGGFLAA